MTYQRLMAVLVQGIVAASPLSAHPETVWYVDASRVASGNGKSPATAFMTISECVAAATAALTAESAGGHTCAIRPGTYRERVAISTQASADAPLVLEGSPDVVISALKVVQPSIDGAGSWEKVNVAGKTLWRITLNMSGVATGPADVFVDGKMLIPARWPNPPVDVDLGRMDRSFWASADGGSVDLGSCDDKNDCLGTYQDSALVGFAADAWKGAFIYFAPGLNWWVLSGTVESSTSGSVTFRYHRQYEEPPGTTGSPTITIDIPNIHDVFLMEGKLEALDAANEFHFDVDGAYGAANALYLSSEIDPRAHLIEVRMATGGVTLNDATHVTVRGLTVLGAPVVMNAATSNTTLDDVTILYGSSGSNQYSLMVNGTNNSVKDSDILRSPQGGVFVKGNNHSFTNNTVGYVGFLHGQGHGLSSTATPTPRNVTGECNTFFFGPGLGMRPKSAASRIRFNEVYEFGRVISDVAGIDLWSSGDGEGTEIAYNHVHDIWSVRGLGRFVGGKGIRVDNGGVELGQDIGRNYVLHHNVVFGTSDISLGIWGIRKDAPGYPDKGNQWFNNTADGPIGFGTPISDTDWSYTGTPFVNNVVGQMTTFEVPLIHFNHNHIVTIDKGEPGQNQTGDPIFENGATHDYRPGIGSPLEDRGIESRPFTDDYWGSAPDIGAYERGKEPFQTGAVLRTRDAAGLQAVCTAKEKESVCEVTGLPEGRKTPPDFVMEVEGITSLPCAAGLRVRTNQSFVTCRIPKVIDRDTTFTPQWSGSGDAPVCPVVASSNAPCSAVYMTPITLTAPLSTYLEHPVRLTIDTATLIARGQMRSDCLDLRVVNASDLSTELSTWIEEETCNTSQTIVWVRSQNPSELDSGIISMDPSFSGIVATHGGDVSPRDNGIENILPGNGEMPALWLSARHLATAQPIVDGEAISHWLDALGRQQLAADQLAAESQPVFVHDGINGFPAIEFDGSNDYLRIGDSLTDLSSVTACVVYSAENGSTSTYPRLLSSEPTDGPDFQYGLSISPFINADDHHAEVTPGRVVCDTFENRDFANLEIARRAGMQQEWFQGRIAEIMILPFAASWAELSVLQGFLEARYRIAAALEVTSDVGDTTQVCLKKGDGGVGGSCETGLGRTPFESFGMVMLLWFLLRRSRHCKP